MNNNQVIEEMFEAVENLNRLCVLLDDVSEKACLKCDDIQAKASCLFSDIQELERLV